MQTFLRAFHIQASADFQRVWKTGKKRSVTSMAIISCENTFGHPRLGISISKKYIRSAVDRNRIKRLAREGFRVRQHQLGSRDIVVVAYKGAEKLAPAEQHQRFNSLWDLYIAQFGTA